MKRKMLCKTNQRGKRLAGLAIFTLCALAWFGMGHQAAATNDWKMPAMGDYVKVPPFISYSVKPNIMIMLDNSDSMNELAYPADYAGEPYNGTEVSVRGYFVTSEAEDMSQAVAGGMIDDENLHLGSHHVGLRFLNVDIPQGARITSAYIRFTAAAEPGDGASDMLIMGHASDDAPAFDASDAFNLSEREQTAAKVPWASAGWMAGEEYDTPDLSAVVQQIVSRQGWKSENAIVLGISAGAGALKAQAHLRGVQEDPELIEDDPEPVEQIGPVLHIEFETVKPGIRYYGYFNPDYFYEFRSNVFYLKYQKVNYDYTAGRWNVRDLGGTPRTLTSADIAPALPANGLWEGNWLNWLGMRRIDVLRKVLLGGLATSRQGTGNQHNLGISGIKKTFDNDHIYDRFFSSDNAVATSPYKGTYRYVVHSKGEIRAYYSSTKFNTYPIEVDKDPAFEPEDFMEIDGNYELAGVLQKVSDQARWGNMWFNVGTGKDQSGGTVANYIDNGFNANMLSTILNKPCETYTPLAESFFVAMQYFKQEWETTWRNNLDYPNNPFDVNKDSHRDPFWDKDLQKQIPCAKSFVLLLTDGAPTRDSKIPSEYIGYARGDNIPEPLRGYRHFEPETTGQACDDEGTTTGCLYPHGGTDYLADLALYARTHDLRPDIVCWDNNLVLYTIVALLDENDPNYANATGLLKKASLLGGFGDTSDDGIPDTYYEAADGYQLERELMRAITDIIARTSSGTAASVVSSSRSGEGAVYQSIFYPSLTDNKGNTLTWGGQVNALLVDAYGNLREDTSGDKRLDLEEDLFLVFETEEIDPDDPCPAKDGGSAKVRKYKDMNANGIFDDADREEGPVSDGDRDLFDLHEIQFLWTSTDWLNDNALDPLKQRTYGSNSKQRYIFTFVNADGTMVPNSANSIKPFVAPLDPAWTDLVDPGNFFAYMHVYEPFRPPVDPANPAFESVVARQARRIVNYIRGQDQEADAVGAIALAPFRNRRIDHNRDGEVQTWRLGDIVHSSPTVVARPAENFDLIYRDGTYTDFYRRYRHRRNVLYVGSNGGMLHAFNGGFYDEVEKQFVVRPVDSLGKEIPMPDGTSRYNDMPLGAELWAYVPFNVLPHLYWLTRTDYEHIYYVDLEPRIFDARIFDPASPDHPNGWGTVLVAGMRFGGGKIATNIDKRADVFDPAVDRAMSSAYAVFDITNPEKPPVLLAELTFPELGFTTCHPGVIPMRGLNSNNEETTNQWYLIFGSGPVSPDAYGETGANTQALLQGTSSQQAVMYAVDLVELAKGNLTILTETNETGAGATPTGIAAAAAAGKHHMVRFEEENSFVSKPIVVDWDLNFNADTVYFGTSFGDHAAGWSGRMRRLVLDDGGNDPTNPGHWKLKNTMLDLSAPLDGSISTGQPISAPATVTIDKAGNRWVYFGTGRFDSEADKTNTDQQSFYGVKEPIIEGSDGSRRFDYAEVRYDDLRNVTGIDVYENGIHLDGYSGTFWDLADDIEKNNAGWRLNFYDRGERNLGQAVLAGEIVTFTTFAPSDDICGSGGLSHLYALYYRTGTAYRQSVIGLNYDITSQGDPLVLKRSFLGPGLTITPNIHVGRQRGTRAFIQTESGSILEMDQLTPGDVKSGKLFWRPDDGPEACPPENP
jgi:Tfp pilus tip-associated adhesin PilY1